MLPEAGVGDAAKDLNGISHVVSHAKMQDDTAAGPQITSVLPPSDGAGSQPATGTAFRGTGICGRAPWEEAVNAALQDRKGGP